MTPSQFVDRLLKEMKEKTDDRIVIVSNYTQVSARRHHPSCLPMQSENLDLILVSI
jgi:hypothetical protein